MLRGCEPGEGSGKTQCFNPPAICKQPSESDDADRKVSSLTKCCVEFGRDIANWKGFFQSILKAGFQHHREPRLRSTCHKSPLNHWLFCRNRAHIASPVEVESAKKKLRTGMRGLPDFCILHRTKNETAEKCRSGRKPKGQHGHPNAPCPNISPLKTEH